MSVMWIVIKKFDKVKLVGVDNFDDLYKVVIFVIDYVYFKGLIKVNKVVCDKLCFFVCYVK